MQILRVRVPVSSEVQRTLLNIWSRNLFPQLCRGVTDIQEPALVN